LLCPFCGTKLLLGKQTVKRSIRKVSVYFNNVPAEVCRCGEVFIDERIASNLSYVLKRLDVEGKTYLVVDYNDVLGIIQEDDEISVTKETLLIGAY